MIIAQSSGLTGTELRVYIAPPSIQHWTVDILVILKLIQWHFNQCNRSGWQSKAEMQKSPYHESNALQVHFCCADKTFRFRWFNKRVSLWRNVPWFASLEVLIHFLHNVFSVYEFLSRPKPLISAIEFLHLNKHLKRNLCINITENIVQTISQGSCRVA